MRSLGEKRTVTQPPASSQTANPNHEQSQTHRIGQKELGSTKADAERAVNAVIEGIKSHLKKSKLMQLVGFGTFKVVNRKARLGVNPKTGERIKIKASKGVKFGAGKDLKSKL